MTRTMVYLPDELHRGLKHLAVERRTSFASLVREAVEMLYLEDLSNLKIGRERLRDYLSRPDQSRAYTSYRQERHKR